MGPFADRIDIHIKVNPVDRDSLNSFGGRETDTGRQSPIHWASTAEMRDKVSKARVIQASRYAGENYSCNGQLDENGIRKYCALGKEGKQLMMASYDRLGLSMRGYNKILRMARTIADLEGCADIRTEHVAEALMYRIDLKQ